MAETLPLHCGTVPTRGGGGPRARPRLRPCGACPSPGPPHRWAPPGVHPGAGRRRVNGPPPETRRMISCWQVQRWTLICSRVTPANIGALLLKLRASFADLGDVPGEIQAASPSLIGHTTLQQSHSVSKDLMYVYVMPKGFFCTCASFLLHLQCEHVVHAGQQRGTSARLARLAPFCLSSCTSVFTRNGFSQVFYVPHSCLPVLLCAAQFARCQPLHKLGNRNVCTHAFLSFFSGAFSVSLAWTTQTQSLDSKAARYPSLNATKANRTLSQSFGDGLLIRSLKCKPSPSTEMPEPTARTHGRHCPWHVAS